MTYDECKKRISAATTNLAYLDLVELAISIELSLRERSELALPRLADECEAIVKLIEDHPPALESWTDSVMK